MIYSNIGFIGPNKAMCTNSIYSFGEQLGNILASNSRTFICGGKQGFMEAVCKGAKDSGDSFFGQTIGIMPDAEKGKANKYIDIEIPTGLGLGRNLTIVQSSDIIIAVGGGAGTLSEIALAWQLGKTVLCVTKFDGWAKELAGTNLDNRHRNLLIPVSEITEIENYLNNG